MLTSEFPRLGAFNLPRVTANGGTAFVAVISPFGGTGPGNAMQYGGVVGKVGGRLYRPRGVSHVNKLIYTTGATAHLISILRPLNYTTLSAAAAAGATTLNLNDDPGIFSTNMKPMMGPIPAQVSDRGIAGGDYIVIQLADGSWYPIKVTSVSTLALTVPAIPSATGALGALAGAMVYLMGLPTDTDPYNGQTQPSTQIASGVTRDVTEIAAGSDGLIAALRNGDPMLFYSPNTTNAGILEQLSGFYADR
jgi:hypothetical protein